MPCRGSWFFFFLILFLGGSVVWATGRVRLPFNQEGYEPVQPIAFSHRLHAGELQIDCRYCHTGAERSRHAGFPSVATCQTCHKFVEAPRNAVRAEAASAAAESRPVRIVFSEEIRKIRDADSTGRPPRWVKVHNLADFVYFDHARHVNGGVDCARCHGPVESMERVRQTVDMNMGWCVSCHRQENVKLNTGFTLDDYIEERAGIDCAKCHY